MPPFQADALMNSSSSELSAKPNGPSAPPELRIMSNDSMPGAVPAPFEETMLKSLSDLFEDEENAMDFFKPEEQESSSPESQSHKSVQSFQHTGEDLFNLSTTSDLQNSFTVKDLIPSPKNYKYSTSVGQALKDCASLSEEMERLQKLRKEKKSKTRINQLEQSRIKNTIDEATTEVADSLQKEHTSPMAPPKRKVEPKISDITISPFASPISPSSKLNPSKLRFLAESCPAFDDLPLDCSPDMPRRNEAPSKPPARCPSAESLDSTDNESKVVNPLPPALSPRAPVKYYKSPKTPTRQAKTTVCIGSNGGRGRRYSLDSSILSSASTCSSRSSSSRSSRRSVTKIPIRCPGLEQATKHLPQSLPIAIKLHKTEAPKTPKRTAKNSQSFSPRKPTRKTSKEAPSNSRWYPTTPKLQRTKTCNAQTPKRRQESCPLRTPKTSQSYRSMSKSKSLSPNFSAINQSSTSSSIADTNSGVSAPLKPRQNRRGSLSCRDFVNSVTPKKKNTSSSQRNFDNVEALPVIMPPVRDYFSGEPKKLAKVRTKSDRGGLTRELPSANPSFRADRPKDFAPKSPRRRVDTTTYNRPAPSGLNHILESPHRGRNVAIQACVLGDSQKMDADLSSWHETTSIGNDQNKLAVTASSKDAPPKAPTRHRRRSSTATTSKQQLHQSLPTGLDMQTMVLEGSY